MIMLLFGSAAAFMRMWLALQSFGEWVDLRLKGALSIHGLFHSFYLCFSFKNRFSAHSFYFLLLGFVLAFGFD
jgi:hypothetical protein